MADYLEQYAERFELPVRSGTRVERVRAKGRLPRRMRRPPIEADNVVVATGTSAARSPGVRADLDPEIVQLHSSEYKNPCSSRTARCSSSAPRTRAPTSRWTSRPRTGRSSAAATPGSPVRHRGPAGRAVVAGDVVPGAQGPDHADADRAEDAPDPPHGGPLLRFKRADLETAGVERTRPAWPAATASRSSTTARSSTSQRDLVHRGSSRTSAGSTCRSRRGRLAARGARRRPVGSRASTSPGLAFQYAFSSMLILGAGRDAEYVANRSLRTRRSNSVADVTTRAARPGAAASPHPDGALEVQERMLAGASAEARHMGSRVDACSSSRRATARWCCSCTAAARRPSRFFRSLERLEGVRAIAVDQPGFGMSDPVQVPRERLRDAAIPSSSTKSWTS